MTKKNYKQMQATTEFGELRSVVRDGGVYVQLKCPDCGGWGDIDFDQLNGKVSVDHTGEGCTYHETHDFATAWERVGSSR